jgi:4-diphosphocytidyl-2-C-methyl-D-erythritol kinase
MKILAPAKVNLYLEIGKKRADGYHELKTIFQTISLCDILEIKKIPPGPIQIKIVPKTISATAHCPANDQNIVWKAATFFFNRFNIKESCSITLTKQIPIQAGLGGGSSDAAAVLKGLSKIFLKNPSSKKIQKELHRLSINLGADVPFFLKGGTAFARGIGEKISFLKSPKKFWMLVLKPKMGLSTPQVYRWVDTFQENRPEKPARPAPKKGLTCGRKLNKMVASIRQNRAVNEWAGCLFNSFEDVVFDQFPELSKIKQSLVGAGAQNALLSGSGSAFFAPVLSKADGDQVKKKLKNFDGEIWVAHSVSGPR